MPWEREPLERFAAEKQLTVYKHKGFWRPMDTLRDKMQLEEMWDAGKAPWKIW
jgi:glucose-1-phosphate cytidylyltransferase